MCGHTHATAFVQKSEDNLRCQFCPRMWAAGVEFSPQAWRQLFPPMSHLGRPEITLSFDCVSVWFLTFELSCILKHCSINFDLELVKNFQHSLNWPSTYSVSLYLSKTVSLALVVIKSKYQSTVKEALCPTVSNIQPKSVFM